MYCLCVISTAASLYTRSCRSFTTAAPIVVFGMYSCKITCTQVATVAPWDVYHVRNVHTVVVDKRLADFNPELILLLPCYWCLWRIAYLSLPPTGHGNKMVTKLSSCCCSALSLPPPPLPPLSTSLGTIFYCHMDVPKILIASTCKSFASLEFKMFIWQKPWSLFPICSCSLWQILICRNFILSSLSKGESVFPF